MRLAHVKTSRQSTHIFFISADTATQLIDFTGEADQITVRYEGNRSMVYCGIGMTADCTPAQLCSTAAKAIQTLQKLKRTAAACTLPSLPLNGAEMHGHQPILLVGGPTGTTGDPPGRNEERQFQTMEQI